MSITIGLPRGGVWESASSSLVASVLDQRGDPMSAVPLRWSSSDTTVARVSQGRIDGRRPGTVMIHAQAGEAEASITIEVQRDLVQRIDLTAPRDSAIVGRTLPIAARFTGVHGGLLEARTPIWTSADTAIALVDTNGVVHAVAPGTTTVRAVIDDAVREFSVRVVPVPIGSVQLTVADEVLGVGGHTTVSALAFADDGSPLPDRHVTIEVLDLRKARLDGSVVHAVGSGIATVRASAEGVVTETSLRIERPAYEPWSAEVVFGANVTVGEQALVHGAVARWAEAILAAAPVEPTPSTLPAGSCGKAQSEPIVNEVITRLRLYVMFDSLDGRGGAVAAAGPCVVARGPSHRPGNPARPVIGIIWVDSTDLRTGVFSTALWHNVLVHEIGHVLGIGTLWHSDAYIHGRDGTEPHYIGANAVREWRTLGGEGIGLDIETNGSGGTAGAHWSDRTYQNEVMTGWVGSGLQPLSLLTLGALADFGWVVDYGQADPYTLPPPWVDARVGVSAPTVRLVERILKPKFETSGGVTLKLPDR